MSYPRGLRFEASSCVPGKVKSSAIPPSDAAPIKGMVVMSTPKDISLRTSLGVLGSLSDNRGSAERPSGIMETDEDSKTQSPETCSFISSSRSSKYRDCCTPSNGSSGAKYADLERVCGSPP